jgi:peptidylprolyl isomerase
MSKQLLRLTAGLCLFAAGCGSDDEKNAKTTPSGLKYIDHGEGVGEPAKADDFVEVHYTGTLRADGTKFDSSHDRKQPFVFQLGRGQVIKGWDEGVAGMKAGGRRKLIIPYNLAYGESGRPPTIPAKADLVFEVELLRILEGVKIEDLREGTGDAVKKGSEIEVFYTGRFKSDGKQFDSNVGQEPFKVTVGVSRVIQGWHQGLIGMKVGGKRKLAIPAHLAYGAEGSPPNIPPNADLEFEIELLRMK